MTYKDIYNSDFISKGDDNFMSKYHNFNNSDHFFIDNDSKKKKNGNKFK